MVKRHYYANSPQQVVAFTVLDDETRVLTQATFLEAIGRHRKANVRDEGGEERVPPILQGKSINPFISKELLEKSAPIQFRLATGGIASGYRAEILPMVCEVYLKARDAGVLPSNQRHVAAQAAGRCVSPTGSVTIMALSLDRDKGGGGRCEMI